MTLMVVPTHDLIEQLGKLYEILDKSNCMASCKNASQYIRIIEKELKDREIKTGLDQFL